jgi:hypothetical protein
MPSCNSTRATLIWTWCCRQRRRGRRAWAKGMCTPWCFRIVVSCELLVCTAPGYSLHLCTNSLGTTWGSKKKKTQEVNYRRIITVYMYLGKHACVQPNERENASTEVEEEYTSTRVIRVVHI